MRVSPSVLAVGEVLGATLPSHTLGATTISVVVAGEGGPTGLAGYLHLLKVDATRG